jgi:hypothetical protein
VKISDHREDNLLTEILKNFLDKNDFAVIKKNFLWKGNLPPENLPG